MFTHTCKYVHNSFQILLSLSGTNKAILLALLVFIQQSYFYGAGVRRPSVRPSSVHPLTQVSRKLLYGSRLILWETNYPPYLQTVFFSFSKFLKFEYLFVFFNMGPDGTPNCKTLLLPQIAPGLSLTSPEFLSPISS